MCHIVDNSDHWSHGDARQQINFLRYSESHWRWFAINPLDLSESLRHSDYLHWRSAPGYRIVEYRSGRIASAMDRERIDETHSPPCELTQCRCDLLMYRLKRPTHSAETRARVHRELCAEISTPCPDILSRGYEEAMPRLPFGLIGDDSLVGALAYWDLDPKAGWDTRRIVVCNDAEFFICASVSFVGERHSARLQEKGQVQPAVFSDENDEEAAERPRDCLQYPDTSTSLYISHSCGSKGDLERNRHLL